MIIIATTKRFKKPPTTHEGVVKLIRYITNPDKTSDEQCLYVNSYNCSVVNTANEFKAVREQWQKNTGNYAYHFEQSFKPGETTAEECHQCGSELAQVLFAKYGYQVIFATHLDKEHLHNHFVVNAVNPIDGKKLQTDHEFIRRMREENDRICKAHNLSVVDEPKGKGKSYGEWITDKNGGFTWRGMIKNDIDDLLPSVTTVKALFNELERIGYKINTRGKCIGLSPPGTNTSFRLHKLGKGYSLIELTERIIKQQYSNCRSEPLQSKRNNVKSVIVVKYRYKGVFSNMKGYRGFTGMYLYYLIKLRKLLNSSPPVQKRMPAQMRKDAAVVNEFAEDLQLLSCNKIDTLEQLTEFYAECNERLQSCYQKRSLLKNCIIEYDDAEKLKNIHQEVIKLNKDITKLKLSVRSAERIYKRTEAVQQTIKKTKDIQKGMMENVSRSRSNRYSGENINGRS